VERDPKNAVDHFGVEDVLPEADRLGVLLAVRLAISATVMAFVSLEGGGVGLILLSAVYAGFTTAVELARRRGVIVGEAVPLCLYLLDGAYLAVVVARTGGVGSPIETLFFLHVVTVILISDRSIGVQVACWDAGLLGGVWLFGSAGSSDVSVLSLFLRESTLLLTAFVTSGVVALHQRRLETAVRRLTDRDPLTGLVNRRGLDRVLRQEISRAARTGGSLALAIVDLDRFKHVNDTLGHQVGDEVLGEVALALLDSVREYDVAARLGGDEFLLVLPGCGSAEAVKVAERLRNEIGQGVTVVPHVTATVGVAVYGVHGTEVEDLVAAADAALYEGKRAGRDRTVRAVDPDPRVALLEPGHQR
jgi:diguanylate cyclase (GGDEF)-like protein